MYSTRSDKMDYDKLIKNLIVKIKNDDFDAELYFNAGKTELLKNADKLNPDERENLQKFNFNWFKSVITNPANAVSVNALLNAKTQEELEKALNVKN
jgi:hypothetical protein